MQIVERRILFFIFISCTFLFQMVKEFDYFEELLIHVNTKVIKIGSIGSTKKNKNWTKIRLDYNKLTI